MINQYQKNEIDKYAIAYESVTYRMGDARRLSATDNLLSVRFDSMLDVGCGRGEMVRVAQKLGCANVSGVEVVDKLCVGNIVRGLAWDLPFNDDSFDLVTCFDVIEHIRDADTVPTLRELQRVARQTIIITAANCSHVVDGVEMHVNRRLYGDWHTLFSETFDGKVEWLPNKYNTVSETWKVTF